MKKFKFYQEFPVIHVLQTPIEVEAESYEEAVKILSPYAGVQIGSSGEKYPDAITVDRDEQWNDCNNDKYDDTQEDEFGIPYIITFSEHHEKIGDSIKRSYGQPGVLHIVWSHKNKEISNCLWYFEQKRQAVESAAVVLRELAKLETKRGELCLGLSDGDGVVEWMDAAMKLEKHGRCILQYGDFSLSLLITSQFEEHETSDNVLGSADALFIYDALTKTSSNIFKK